MTVRIGVSRWEDVPGETIERYWDRLREAGLEPVDLSGPGRTLDGCGGLVLTGGVDIDPDRYGEERHERVRRVEAARDEYEVALVERCLEEGLPVLGICRGHQLLNVAFGGSLLQHIEGGAHSADYRSEGFPSRSHDVTIDAQSRLRAWLGADTLVVNSRHHQAVTPDRLAPGLRIAALSSEGLVEALESERHPWVVGVQWHPEREEAQLSGFFETSARLFRAFAAAVSETARAR